MKHSNNRETSLNNILVGSWLVMKMCGTPLDFTGTFFNKLGEGDWMGWVSCDEVKDNRTLPGLDNSQGSFWEARGVKPLACEATWIGTHWSELWSGEELSSLRGQLQAFT